jgi:hypothetical protein
MRSLKIEALLRGESLDEYRRKIDVGKCNSGRRFKG